MVAAVLALLCAIVYGAADFLGGLAARRTALIRVVLIAQIVGALLLVPIAGAGAPPWMGFADLAWVIVAGLGLLFGYAGLYGALAAGTMTVVAPITAIVAIVLPVLAAVGFGERPGPLAVVGIVVALVAVLLISRGTTDAAGTAPAGVRGSVLSNVLIAVGAGAALGIAFVAYDRVAPETGLWPVVLARFVAAAGFVVILLRGGLGGREAGPWRVAAGIGLAAGAGVLDAAANALFLLATRSGSLAVAAPLASLYPASTILLARIVLHERMAPVQVLGLAIAGIAAVLLALA